MDEMTDYQFRTILKLVYELLDNSESLEEAKEKVKALLDKDTK